MSELELFAADEDAMLALGARIAEATGPPGSTGTPTRPERDTSTYGS